MMFFEKGLSADFASGFSKKQRGFSPLLAAFIQAECALSANT
jgi:hypothetical protein